MKRLRDWLDGTINEYLWLILVSGSLLAIILLHKKPQDPRSMRYYPDDIIKVVTIDPQQASYCAVQGVPQPGVISEETIVAAHDGGTGLVSSFRELSFQTQGPIGPDHLPLAMIRKTTITMLWRRPWYNHLRAAWDSIFKTT